MTKENALIYKRVSTEEQTGDGTYSLETQTRICMDSIERSNKYKLADNGIYSDPGKSGTNVNRPGLQDMLVRIQEDTTIKAVFVQDTDRLARNASDHLMIRALLKKHGVILISVSQPGIEDSPEGNLMDLVIAGINQFQSQLTGRKTKKSLEERFKMGWYPTKAPLGYLNSPDPISEEKRIIIIDPVRGPLVKELFKLYATGNYTLLEIRDVMFKKGFINLSGNKLARSQVAKILNNSFYYGEMHWNELTNTGHHPPLTTKEIYRRCQQIKAEHNGFRCRRRKYNFLLRGFIYCFSCGKRWTAEKQLKKKKEYYRCNAQSHEIRCGEKYIGILELEKQVENEFLKIQFSPEFIARIVSRAEELYKKQKENYSKDKVGLINQKNNFLNKLEVAEEKLLSGIFSDKDFTRIKSKIMPLIENLDDEIAKVEQVRSLRIDIIQKLLNLIRNLGESYKSASPELKRVYLGLFWKRFEVADGIIQKSVLNDVIEQLIAVGMVKADNKDELIPFESIFGNSNKHLINSVRITTTRGD
ncbi:MAG: recombinase family protein [archaeon]